LKPLITAAQRQPLALRQLMVMSMVVLRFCRRTTDAEEPADLVVGQDQPAE
jgi:hypothetical protein